MRTPPINPKIIASIPVMISTSLVAGAVYYGNGLHYLSPLILGVIAGGLADLDNGLTGRLKNILFTIIAFSISSWSVQMTFDEPIFLIGTFTALAFIFTLLGAAGNRYRTIAFATLVVGVYTGLSHEPHTTHHVNTLLILLGTLLYSGASVLTHLIFPNRPVQENMIRAYCQLGHYLNHKADFFDPDEADHLESHHIVFAMSNTKVIEAFNACRQSLFYRMRGQHRHPRTTKMLRYYFIAQDIHERISSSHVHYQAFAQQMKHSDLIYRIQRLLRLQSQACLGFADSLRDNQDSFSYPAKLERATQGAEQALHFYAKNASESSISSYRVQRLLDNIIHVSLQLNHLGNPQAHQDILEQGDNARITSPETRGLKGAWRVLKQQNTLQSSELRHAIRMAIIVFTSCILVQFMPDLNTSLLPFESLQKNDLPHVQESLNLGFWVLLTAIFVCQPNYSATKKRLIQRIMGTVFGVLVGSSLPLFVFSTEVKLGMIVLMTTLFFLFRSHKHSYATFFITIQAILSLSIIGHDVTHFFVPRVMDTVVGSTISGLAVYFLWPDWRYLSLEKTGAQAIKSNGEYLQAILNELEQYVPSNNLAYRSARRHSHNCAATLSSTLSDMSSEANKYADKLQDGFLLLKINYSLISYISALGAYRDKIHCDNDAEAAFLDVFFVVAKRIVMILKEINQLETHAFQTALVQLQQDLEALRPHYQDPSHAQNQMLWQQLAMISELLLPCYQALHGKSATPETQEIQEKNA